MVASVSPSAATPSRPAATRPPADAAADGYAGTAQPLEPKALRQVMGQFATGVTVITTGTDGERRGMTANSFTSLSLDPPLVLFCANNGSATLEAVRKNGTFAVNVLSEGQRDECRAFAGKVEGDRFAGRQVQAGPVTGAPLLEGSLARMECKVSQVLPGGDHQIVIGEVVGMDRTPGAEPLVFWGGQVQEFDGWIAR